MQDLIAVEDRQFSPSWDHEEMGEKSAHFLVQEKAFRRLFPSLALWNIFEKDHNVLEATVLGNVNLSPLDLTFPTNFLVFGNYELLGFRDRPFESCFPCYDSPLGYG